MSPRPAQKGYIGRFAPSPTGDLHFGSLVAAVGSFLQARANDGQWLIRVEDIDPPREITGSAEGIIADLGSLGMRPDGAVLCQSRRLPAYAESWQALQENGLAFSCSCSRKQLPADGIYPGTCRSGPVQPDGRLSIRVCVEGARIHLTDGVMGELAQDLEHEVGDFVIRRADGLPAYQLAVVVDDAFQRVTEVVRGADLLDSTPRQVFLQKALGLPTPAYLHLPVATGPDGEKLGKRLRSDPVNREDPAGAVSKALAFLGHAPPPGLELNPLWAWAVAHWDTRRIPRCKSIPAANYSVLG